MPGHHVVWLPTAEDEIAVVRRITELIITQPALRIAKQLNDEGVASPNAGRSLTRGGRTVEVSGLWTANSVRNVASHPALVSLMEYGRRGSGDQLRFTPAGPRPLDERDFDGAGRRKTITNPESERTSAPIPGNPTPVIEHARRDSILVILEERGKRQRGKPRARGDAPNPLGGRLYDMNCGWPMYRYVRRKKWCYTCALYQASEAGCCEHNTVAGAQLTRLVLRSIRQHLLSPARLEGLRDRLKRLAAAERGQDGSDARRRSIENRLARVRKDLDAATRNMTFAEDDEQRTRMQSLYAETKRERMRLEDELSHLPPAVHEGGAEVEVEAALAGLANLLADDVDSDIDYKRIGELFSRMDARLYLKFHQKITGKRKHNLPCGGVLALGAAPPPVPLYEGPADRPSVKKMLEAGESVSPILGMVPREAPSPVRTNSGQQMGSVSLGAAPDCGGGTAF